MCRHSRYENIEENEPNACYFMQETVRCIDMIECKSILNSYF